MKGCGDGRPGVARGRHHDHQWSLAALLQARKTRREEARTEILERRRRPMEQLEHMIIGGRQGAQWRIEVEGLLAQFGQRSLQGIVMEIRGQHRRGGLCEGTLR
ncbi:hypothetical protein D3C71_1900410 [compost metagenome]